MFNTNRNVSETESKNTHVYHTNLYILLTFSFNSCSGRRDGYIIVLHNQTLNILGVLLQPTPSTHLRFQKRFESHMRYRLSCCCLLLTEGCWFTSNNYQFLHSSISPSVMPRGWRSHVKVSLNTGSFLFGLHLGWQFRSHGGSGGHVCLVALSSFR